MWKSRGYASSHLPCRALVNLTMSLSLKLFMFIFFSSPESRRLTRWAILITLRPWSVRKQFLQTSSPTIRTTWPNPTKFHRNVPCMVLFRIPSKKSIPCRTLVAMATKRKNLKNLLLQNGPMDFIVIWYECSLGGPLLDSLNKFWSDKKHSRRGRGLFSLYDI